MFKRSVGFLFKKDVQKNFTKVPNEVFGLNLDPYQKLVLIYLHSKSDDFVFYQSKIAEVLGISRQTVAKCIADLNMAGYLKFDGKSFSLMLTTLTSDVNRINIADVNPTTVDVNPATVDVNPATLSVAKLTRDVNVVNTNKKTENNKTEYKEQISAPLLPPTPVASVATGAEKMNLNYDGLMKYFKDSEVEFKKVMKMHFQEKINYLNKLTNDYDLQLQMVNVFLPRIGKELTQQNDLNANGDLELNSGSQTSTEKLIDLISNKSVSLTTSHGDDNANDSSSGRKSSAPKYEVYW